MTLSTLPLGYCTNVHPARTLAEVRHGLQAYTQPIQQAVGQPIAAGLWLPRSAVTEIDQTPGAITELADLLGELGLVCYTLNTFPFGNFHSERVKEQVYLPDWSQPERLLYTLDCARLLAQLLPPGTDGSLSTVPLGFKGFAYRPDFYERCHAQLLTLARELHLLYEQTGQRIRLAIEPEPYCLLETTPETLQFFAGLFQAAERTGERALATEYLGLCYDVCHQAVEFEDIPASIAALHQAGIRFNKVHITCALQCEAPAENHAGRELLAQYVEQRYLHQTIAHTSSGGNLRSVDLSQQLTERPPATFEQAERWRIHFHVPVDADDLGPLGTTRAELRQALAVMPDLPYAPHLEVETYTWAVMPGATATGTGPERLISGLTRELQATQALLQA